MIFRETDPGMVYSRHIQELSDIDKSRLREICEELKAIFNAESVAFECPEMTASSRTNYTLRIFGGNTIGHIID